MVCILSVSPCAMTYCSDGLLILRGQSYNGKTCFMSFSKGAFECCVEKNVSELHGCTLNVENFPFFVAEPQSSTWLHSPRGEYWFFFLAEPHSLLNVEDHPLITIDRFSPTRVRLKRTNSFTQL